MSHPKEHHTVPRVYLENFTDDDGRLTVYSKRREQYLRPTPQKALVRYYYYSQPVDGIDRENHDIETKLLHDLEDAYPALYESLLHKKENVDLEVLFQTLLMIRSRSPSFREAFELGLADLVDSFRRGLPKPQVPDEISAKYPDIWNQIVVSIDPHRSLCAMAHYITEYARCIIDCSYAIWHAPKGCEFITSDNPVIWYERSERSVGNVVYPRISNRRTRVIFPLNKQKILYGRLRRDREPYLRLDEKELSRQAMREINELQLGCAWDDVVGNIKLPQESRKKYSLVSPHMKIDHFEDKTNHFILSKTTLAPLRPKHKFKRK